MESGQLCIMLELHASVDVHACSWQGYRDLSLTSTEVPASLCSLLRDKRPSVHSILKEMPSFLTADIKHREQGCGDANFNTHNIRNRLVGCFSLHDRRPRRWQSLRGFRIWGRVNEQG